jgi:hypothetical protein
VSLYTFPTFSKAIVIVDDGLGSQDLSAAMVRAIAALGTSVRAIAVAQLPPVPDLGVIYCPLTLNLPPTFAFWGQSIAQTCQDINTLRHLAATTIGVKVGDRGNMWLPVIWTARGPIYGEVIGAVSPGYQQPVHFNDSNRQPLYQFAYQLLTQLTAPPATYLVQFSKAETEIVFDRLFPFPAIPALASIGVQHPDLFDCHWRCITQQPIIDVYLSSVAD